ncbi:hypothetical protein [Alkalihalobacterium bogoriense]|uniref:hypothetical protein n=1 Tax=Alkalihalobacterium bogoriense TaxID=246272 RepID=UPI00047E3DED|nr:hypothetical protein [Alkalihalobacterium bogoriense]
MKKWVKAVIILLCVSVVFQLYQVMKISQLSYHNKMLTEQLDSNREWVDNRLTYIEEKLHEVNQANQWIPYVDFQPNQDQSSASNIVLDMEWSFNEINVNDSVTVFYKDVEEKDWSETEATFTSGTTYTSTVNLNPTKTYIYKIVSDGDIKKGTDQAYIPEHLYRASNVSISYSTSKGRENDPVLFEATIEQYDVNFEFQKVESATATLNFKDGTTKTVPFTKGAYEEEYYNDEWDRDGEYWSVRAEEKDILSVDVEWTFQDGNTQHETYYIEHYYLDE